LSSKIALLIDAENISHKYLPHILEEAELQGDIVLKAVYGNWENPPLQKWYEVAAKSNLRIRHQANPSKIKNSSDMKLIMDAMEVLYRIQVDGFCLVTNDADYVPLCDKIHEAQKLVIGIGTPQAAEGFIRACDKFIFVGRGESSSQPLAPLLTELLTEIAVNSPKPVVKMESAVAETNQQGVQKILVQAFSKALPEDAQWITLSTLGSYLRKIQSDFQSNNYGHSTLTKLLQTLPEFVELKIEGTVTSARLKDAVNAKALKLNTLQKLILDAFAKAQQDDPQWISLTSLGTAISQVVPGFRLNGYGHSTLTKLLQSMPEFVEVQAVDGVNSARLKKI